MLTGGERRVVQTGGGLLHEVLETLVRGTLRGRGGRDAPAKLKHTPKLTFYR
jgi:hypothetical protein